jgi:hypothetical protein
MIKLVKESLDDILKPKSKEQLLKDLKDKFIISDIKLTFNSGYDFNEFIKIFRRNKYYQGIFIGKNLKNYERKDFTEEAIQEFIKAKNKLELYNPNCYLKLFNISNKNNTFISLMFSFNKSKNIKKYFNKIFDEIYMGDDYAFFNGNNLSIFIIPNTFIKKYFPI